MSRLLQIKGENIDMRINFKFEWHLGLTSFPDDAEVKGTNRVQNHIKDKII